MPVLVPELLPEVLVDDPDELLPEEELLPELVLPEELPELLPEDLLPDELPEELPELPDELPELPDELPEARVALAVAEGVAVALAVADGFTDSVSASKMVIRSVRSWFSSRSF